MVSRVLLALVLGAALPACFLVHSPGGEFDGGPGDDGGPEDDGSTGVDCYIAPDVQIVDRTAGCRCLPEGSIRVRPELATGDVHEVCNGVDREDPIRELNGTLCLDGLVYPTDQLVGAWGSGIDYALLRCISGPACVYTYGTIVGMEPPLPCAYSDLTLATTGRPPPIECASASPQGLCGSNCPCSVGSRCFGLSEDHPTGVCARTNGRGGEGVCDPEEDELCGSGERCMRPRVRPEWVDSSRVYPLYPTNRGYCVPELACARADALYPGVWDCLE